MPSPIVELNRAVAVGRAFGLDAGLELIAKLEGEKALEQSHLLPAVRGDLLVRAGRVREAQADFARAASMTGNERERAVLLRRAGAVRA